MNRKEPYLILRVPVADAEAMAYAFEDAHHAHAYRMESPPTPLDAQNWEESRAACERVEALFQGALETHHGQDDAPMIHAAQDALESLRDALAFAKLAKAPRTTNRIRLAISSAKGAIRAACYRTPRP